MAPRSSSAGFSDAGTLEEISELCGTIVIGEDDSKTVRVVPPELIRALPDWRALVIRMNLSPVIVKFRPAWKRLATGWAAASRSTSRAGSPRRKPPIGTTPCRWSFRKLADELPQDGPSYAGSLTPSHRTGSGGED